MIDATASGASTQPSEKLGVALLAEEWAFEILDALAEEPSTAEQLQRQLASRHVQAVRRGLRRMTQMRLLETLQPNGHPRQALYVPTSQGFDLLDAMLALRAWQAPLQRNGAGGRGDRAGVRADGAGIRALVTRREPRLVMRALVEGELPFTDIQRRVPGLSPGTLQRVLTSLREQGIVREHPHPLRRHDIYALDEAARGLASVALLSARWLWRWWPEHASLEACDLPGIVHLVAPLVTVPKGIDAVCRLVAEPQAEAKTDRRLSVWVRIAGGRLCALAMQPVLHADPEITAAPAAWCEALLHGERRGITVEGECSYADAVLAALSETISSW